MSCIKRQREDGVWEFLSMINQDVLNRTTALEVAKLSHDSSISTLQLALPKKIDQGNFTKTDSVIMGTGLNSYVERDLAYLKTIVGLGTDSIIGVPYAGTSTGSASEYVISSPTLTKALVIGQAVSFYAHIANGAIASNLKWSIEPAHPITKQGGGIPNIKQDIITVRWNGTNFVLQGEGASGNATASDLLLGLKADTDVGPITGTLALTGSAISGDVVAGKTFYNTNAKVAVTGTMVDRNSANHAATAYNGTLSAGRLYLRPPIGYYDGVSPYVYYDDVNYISANIKTGTSMFGLGGTFTSDANAAAGDIRSGQTAYVNGVKITGNRAYYAAGARPTAGALWTGGNNIIYLQLPPGGGIWDSADVYVCYTVPNLIPTNIVSGVDVCGVTGTRKPMPAISYNGSQQLSSVHFCSNSSTTSLSKLGSVTVTNVTGTIGFKYTVGKSGSWSNSGTYSAVFQIYKNGAIVSSLSSTVSFSPNDPMAGGVGYGSGSLSVVPGDVIDCYGYNTYSNPGSTTIYQTFEIMTSVSLI